VGAIAGCGVIAAGFSVVNWTKMGQIVASWFISPVAGGIIGFLIFTLISKLILQHYRPARVATRYAPFLILFTFFIVAAAIVFKGLKHIVAEENIAWLTGHAALAVSALVGIAAALFSRWYLGRKLEVYFRKELTLQLERVEKVFAPLVFITSCTVAFAHGANDVANSVGPLAAVVEIFKTGTVAMKVPVPVWVLMLGGGGIVVGLAMYGYRVMRTVGEKITRITPSRGLAADIAAMTTVLVCSRLKLPVSTTHTLVGSIMGVALARGIGAVDKDVTRKIFGSWLITVPVAALFAITIFMLGRWLLLERLTALILEINGS
jgi:PiT family inorganic phosphate transporter